MKEIAAVQHGNDLYARRQDAVVEFVHLFVNGLKRGLLFCTFPHQHCALDYIRLVDDAPVLHVVGSRHVAQPDLRPCVTSAMSLTRRAVPVCVFMTVCSMSATLL